METMTVQEYLRRTFYLDRRRNNTDLITRQPALCADGFDMSIQASAYHYCTPRETKDIVYEEVEVGFPSVGDYRLEPYETDAGSVYGRVPISIVQEIADSHGGIIGSVVPRVRIH